MRLRFSIVGTIVAGAYVVGACLLAAREMRGDGCMGWCFGLATFPEFLVLFAFPAAFFYSPAWQHFFVWVFGIGAIGLNAFIVYVIFGGVAWWGGLQETLPPHPGS
jgi:hypothetical protein